jgi:hypothetical protein
MHRITQERNVRVLVFFEEPVCSELLSVYRQVGQHVGDRSCIAEFVLVDDVSSEVRLCYQINPIQSDIARDCWTGEHGEVWISQLFWGEYPTLLRNNRELAVLVRTFEPIPTNAKIQPAELAALKSFRRSPAKGLLTVCSSGEAGTRGYRTRWCSA